VLEAVQRRLDEDPQAMRRRRETVEHPFGTSVRKGRRRDRLEIIAKLATVLEVEPAELLRVPAGGRELNTWSAQSGIRSRNYLIFGGH
jgi:hypothetical protein